MDDWQFREQCDVLMGFNGAQIIDEPKQINEINNPLKGKCNIEIINHFKDLPVNFCIYDETTLYAPTLDELSISVATSNHFTPKAIDDLDTFFERDFPKLVLVCKEADMPKIIERSKSLHSDEYHGFQTAATLFEYVNPKVSKSAGIRRICEIHNISIDEVCVFGDAQNDHDMLKNCGWGVCMINGTDATKALSDDITDLSNNEDGVADYIEKHFL